MDIKQYILLQKGLKIKQMIMTITKITIIKLLLIIISFKLSILTSPIWNHFTENGRPRKVQLVLLTDKSEKQEFISHLLTIQVLKLSLFHGAHYN